MQGRYFRLSIILIMLATLALMWGCDQPEDVVAPVSTTLLTVSPQQLPTLPEGYIYEVWAVDTADSHHSLGTFYWDSYWNKMYDVDSTEIDTIWTIENDLLDPYFSHIAVSVEAVPDSDPAPGPIMLIDEIADPEDRPLTLEIPLDFSLSTAVYSLATPTKLSKDPLDKIASGVWFAQYVYDSVFRLDTTRVSYDKDQFPTDIFLEIETLYFICDSIEGVNCVDSTDITDLVDAYPDTFESERWEVEDTLNLDEVSADSVWVGIACTSTVAMTVIDTLHIDTFTHYTMSYDSIFYSVNTSDSIETYIFTDTCTGVVDTFEVAPFKDYHPSITHTTNGYAELLDLLLEYHDEVPSLEGTDWHYKGWVFSPYLPSDCSELGRLAAPDWIKFYLQQLYPDYENTPIVTTGPFKKFGAPDDFRGYSEDGRIMKHPGEDFIANLPCGETEFHFAEPGESLAKGAVIVTLEPDNFSSNENFPIIVFSTISGIPPYDVRNLNEPNFSIEYRLTNHTGSVVGSPYGFPMIKMYIDTR